MKKYSVYFWAIITLIFLCFIGIMSYWYPTTSDEYNLWHKPVTWEMIRGIYLQGVPRISAVIGAPIYYLGKWSFILFNPLVQLANCLCLFYIVFLRLPDIKEMKDLPFFLIILFMSVFFVCVPTDVIFWVSGSLNYSWLILFPLLLICFLRQIYAQKFVFKDTILTRICFFILGVCVGMNNEAVIPFALAGTICFALFCEYKKIKTPRALSFLIFGLTIGCFIFFSAPAHYYKMTTTGFASETAIPFSQKLFFHIYHMDTVLKSSFYVQGIVLVGAFLCAIDKDNKNLKQDTFICSLIFLLLGFALSTILIFAPMLIRAHYPSSVMFVLSFLFFIKYISDNYKFNFSKLFCFLIVGACLYMSPRFVYPNYYLHLQEEERNLALKHNPNAEIKPYVFLMGPTNNLTIMLLDWANHIKVGENSYIVKTNAPINW